MRYDRQAYRLLTEKVSDGMGGATESFQRQEGFSAHMPQLAHELTLMAYGYDASRDYRLFSWVQLELGETIEVDGSLFKVIRTMQSGRRCSSVVRALEAKL